MQQYLLGKYLRSRYDGFLSKDYSPYEILAQSSTVDRTIMSADANLAGLYPPEDAQSHWNPEINWQPIPVHNKPEYIDNVSCNFYLKAYCCNILIKSLISSTDSLSDYQAGCEMPTLR